MPKAVKASPSQTCDQLRPEAEVREGRPESAASTDSAGSYQTLPLREAEWRRLAGLGLSGDDFQCMQENFVGHPFDFIRKGPRDRRWVTIRKRRLTNAHLVGHLRGDHWIGTGCRWNQAAGRLVTRFIVIDLDYGGRKDEWDKMVSSIHALEKNRPGSGPSLVNWKELLTRYDRVVQVLGRPTFLFQSSSSGGLHAYYHFQEEVELHSLRTPDGPDGAIVRLIRHAGLAERAGSMEVYPRGQYKKRGLRNRLRLPFGLGSVMLDPYTLERVSQGGGPADLKQVRRMFDLGKVEFADAHAWIESADRIEASTTHTRRPLVLARTASPRAHDSVDLEGLLVNGLTGSGQLNRAILTLAKHARRQRVSEHQASAEIREWLECRHNHQSRTYNSSRSEAFEEVESVVGRVYGKSAPRAWAEIPGLSEFEAGSIIRPAMDDFLLADPETGEITSRFKIIHMGFELLRHAKQWLLTVGHEQGWKIEVGKKRSKDIVEVWPDSTKPEFIVPIPLAHRERLEGIGRKTQRGLWRTIQRLGVCQLSRGASAEAHRAATYLVPLDFHARSDHRVRFNSAEEAIASLVQQEQIDSAFSRHYRDRIRDAARIAQADIKLVEATIEEAMIRECLRGRAVDSRRVA